MQVMEKIMGTVVKDSPFLMNTELDHHLPIMQLISSLEWTHISSE